MSNWAMVGCAALCLASCAGVAGVQEEPPAVFDLAVDSAVVPSTDLAVGCNVPFVGEFCPPTIYVSTRGDDLNSGATPLLAVRTLTVGMARAIRCEGSPCPILVAAGTYSEQVALRDGLTIYGGYSQNFQSHDPAANEVILTSNESRTVIADGLIGPTIVDGLTINGATFLMPDGRSSYAVWANATQKAVRFVNVKIHAGRGADGRPGALGAEIACGTTAASGGTAVDCGSSAGSTGNAAGDPVSGGAPGAGGTSACPNGCPLGGTDGITNGMAGSAGGNGRDGVAGVPPGANIGTFSGGMWASIAMGRAGERGLNGTGGGGGGSGGTKGFRNCFGCGVLLGGRGGDGGPGGCGGGGGGPGSPGGGAFAILLNDADIIVDGAEITGGTAGNGGAGGDGHDGLPGGANGMNGVGPAGHQKCDVVDYNSGSGGLGGVGGKGGAGGGGGGGAGGAAITIARVGNSNLTQMHVVDIKGGVAGGGGLGGHSTGNPGAAGPAGLMAVDQKF